MTGTLAAVQATCRRSAYRPHRVAGRKAEYGRFSVLPRPEIYRNLRIKDSVKIDPPYNAGNEGWVYNDNVNDPRIHKWLREVVGKEGDLSRHDKWLCMMYPRLKLLHRLLSEDGAIFVGIDDNEYANLKLICDEIFGGANFPADLICSIVSSLMDHGRL